MRRAHHGETWRAYPIFRMPIYFAEAAFAGAFFRSAHRSFMASAMRLRPSGESLRAAVFFAGSGVLAFLLPFGRPGRRGLDSASAPESRVRACCSLAIWASISAMILVTSKCHLHAELFVLDN